MIKWITDTINSLGYTGIGLLMFAENIWPPIPSEVIMPLAGFTAAQGDLGFFLVVFAGTLGATFGTLIWYEIGYFLGKERVLSFVDRHGKWLTISRKDIEKADYWFDRHNRSAVFFGRFIPGVRTVISLPAGVSGMRLTPFLIYTTLGTLIWTAFLALLGYFLRENWQTVEQYIGYIVPTLVVVVIVWYVMRLVRHLNA